MINNYKVLQDVFNKLGIEKVGLGCHTHPAFCLRPKQQQSPHARMAIAVSTCKCITSEMIWLVFPELCLSSSVLHQQRGSASVPQPETHTQHLAVD
jgi:hypothetical protein